jgi:hypothetical protein
MKIIATTTGGYICEISRPEAHIIFDSTVAHIGDENDLHKAYELLSAIRSLSKSQLHYLDQSISGLNKKFAEVQESYDKLMLLDNIRSAPKDL